MMFSEIVQKEAQEMREEGRAEGIEETAKNMFANGISSELIAKCTGLPLEQVLALQKELQPVKA